MQYQLDQEKNNLSKAKKKKDINSINENIATLEKKNKESESLINQQFSLYEGAELERKELVEEAQQLENIQLSEEYDSLPSVTQVDIAPARGETSYVEANYIQKNNSQLDTVVVDIPVAIEVEKSDEVLTETSSVDDENVIEEVTVENEIVVEDYVAPEEMEHYNEVSESLEATTTDIDDFDDVTETVISYDNPNAQIQVEELENDKVKKCWLYKQKSEN